MNPYDEQICQRIADAWQEAGGDAEGFAWNWRRVLEILRARECEAEQEAAP